ncbi:beta-1,6-N-acetylglucosaminyltransferase [Paracoccus sp. TK19116]|uniref:Peptide O-xylosyltransferase n=1 Tax=Paracoccus albicereus TaxID=2922394 RepID=A0ABT1MR77_9RHOB|nr:DUF5928 domain-containing protein [Paracoccus albicereus]MCQ0970814.1 beta-1,6-N-acetylglucosaminyltransferase [Paracoccus albicereus]
MAKIAFILLCHKNPDGVIAQVNRLTGSGDYVALHYDGRAPLAEWQRIETALAGNPRVVFAGRRIRCGWGEWSLVAATLEAVRAALDTFADASHLYMMSGDCMPVKSSAYAHEMLDAEDVDYIENVDFFDSDWIKTGFKAERLIYRHWFNERRNKRLFYASQNLQARLGLTRKVPDGLAMRIGSQWWCLRRQTVEAVLDFAARRRDVMRFFATTWIPDETFFQTLVPHLVPANQIASRTLTFLMFTDYGMPVTFYNDHFDLLLRQDYLFARKVSPEAQDLLQQLADLWQSDRTDFPISGEGPALHRFLVSRGREGRRFAPRFWDDAAILDRGDRLHVIVAKKWHVAKRLTAAIRDRTELPAIDYVFNEIDAGLPDLGGIETTLDKRQRHRRALIGVLMERLETRRLVLCIDPAAQALLRDLVASRAATRVLFIDGDFDDAYLAGHIVRVGLAGQGTPRDRLEALVPTMRADLAHEARMLRDMGLPWFAEIGPGQDQTTNGDALARFLDVPAELGHDLAATPHLFAD